MAVDVLDLQMRRFAQSHSSGIQSAQQGSVFEILGALENRLNFIVTEYQGQTLGTLGKRDTLDFPLLREGDGVQEA